MKYALIIIGDESKYESLPPEADWYGRIDTWAAELRAKGKYTGGGAELAKAAEARSVHGTTVTDGPYLESKEVIGGFEIVSAESDDEAVEYARTWPGVAEGWVSIEVRRIIEH